MSRLDHMEGTLDTLNGRVDRILALLGDAGATPGGGYQGQSAPPGNSFGLSTEHRASQLPNHLLGFPDSFPPQSFTPDTAGRSTGPVHNHHEPSPAHLDTPLIHENNLHAPVEALHQASAETAPGFVTRSPSPELADAAHLLGNLAHASSHTQNTRPSKRRRTTYELALAMVKEEPSGKQDLVSRGLLSEPVARELFNTFLTHCLQFAPFLDPSSDTFEDLRDNSPLCFNALCTVTARAEKLPPEKGSLSQIMSHTLQMARSRLFAPSFSLSDIQAISLLSTWNSHGYVTAGLATRMALDMHYDTAIDRLTQLVKQRTGHNGVLMPPSPDQQKQERELVVEARLFCHLYFHDLNQSV